MFDISSNCLLFQLPSVQLFEMCAHCANAGTEMISPCIDSSVDNVLLQTNVDFSSNFFNSFLNAIW